MGEYPFNLVLLSRQGFDKVVYLCAFLVEMFMLSKYISWSAAEQIIIQSHISVMWVKIRNIQRILYKKASYLISLTALKH